MKNDFEQMSDKNWAKYVVPNALNVIFTIFIRILTFNNYNKRGLPFLPIRTTYGLYNNAQAILTSQTNVNYIVTKKKKTRIY